MLNEQLQKQIKDQAEAIYDKVDELAREQDSYDFGLPMFYKETCPIEKGLTQYAALWQAAEEKAARYEKALKSTLIDLQKNINPMLEQMGMHPLTLMEREISESLTPKTSEDEK